MGWMKKFWVGKQALNKASETRGGCGGPHGSGRGRVGAREAQSPPAPGVQQSAGHVHLSGPLQTGLVNVNVVSTSQHAVYSYE